MKYLFNIVIFYFLSQQIWANASDSLLRKLEGTSAPYGRVLLLLEISDVYEFSDPVLSGTYVKQALTVAQNNSKKGKIYTFRRLEGICYYYLGVLERHKANFKEALHNYEMSIGILNGLSTAFPDSSGKTKVDQANVLNAIGNLHFLNQNYTAAYPYFKDALDIYYENKDTLKIAGTQMNVGAIYENTNKLDEALTQYLSSLKFYKQMNHERLLAVCLNNLGNVYKRQSRFALADSVYQISLKTRRQINDIKGASVVLNNLSELRLLQGKYVEALAYGKESLVHAQEVGNLSTMRHTYENISKAQAKLNLFKDAYENQVLLRQLNDSILGIEKQKALLEFQQKYETLLKENENVMLREKLVRRKFYISLLIGALVLAVFTFVLLLLISRAKNQALKQKQILLAKEQQITDLELQQQKELMELKSKELSSLTLQIINKNEALNNLKNRLSKIENSQYQSEMNAIMRDIEANFQLDDEWQKFKLHFEAVNNDFFDKLASRYPSLTQYEVKLCVYLKINLTTKEISQMLNTSVDAINKARQRLRKKLNIESETDLAAHFQSF
jgi:tetratricopeptide (TPR) repeat protein/DNA-binding CsgD family transcriptional regulator